MQRHIAFTLLTLVSSSEVFGCSIDDRAALKTFGCSDAQITKRCDGQATANKVTLATLKPVSRPREGVLTGKVGGAPFRVTTPSDGGFYYLKLSSPSDKKGAVMTMFVNGGSALETKVPIGSYVLRYATGSDWYGQKHLFGPCKTRFFEAQSILEFSRSGNRLSGNQIELIKQVGGNLGTAGVDEDDF